MRIAFITAGAAGMFCGSCMRDNTLAAALVEAGHDALLIPTYTPITTDEPDVSGKRVFFGGINVFLQQKSWVFRHTPRFLDRVWDIPALLRWVSRFAARTPYSELAALTISMLEGTHGKQKKEFETLVAWLETEVKPDVVVLTNVLLSGMIPEFRGRLGVPVLATLQGDDIFLDALPAADRETCLALIRRNCSQVDGFISTSRFYADHMAEYLRVDRAKMRVVYPGLNLKGHGPAEKPAGDPPVRIGYFARVCPEKGFHNIVDAFIALRKMPGGPACVLRASGWLGESNLAFFAEQKRKLEAAGLLADFEYTPSPDHDTKVRFFQGIDILCVPTTYREPKGLYVLEAWANGVPVVLPAHGTFPELIDIAGGGILFPPGDTPALAAALRELANDPARRRELAVAGAATVHAKFTAAAMARETMRVLEEFVRPTEVARAAAV